jgi:hypothetical protein
LTFLEIILMLLFTFAAAIAVHYTFLSFYVPAVKDILEHARQDDAITKVLVHAENLYGKGGSHYEGFRHTGKRRTSRRQKDYRATLTII